jgi:hypothetical protein
MFALKGTAACPTSEEIVESFWMSMSDQLEIVEPKDPAVAVVLAYGQHEVCQVVACFNPITDNSMSTMCCTTVNTVEGY